MSVNAACINFRPPPAPLAEAHTANAPEEAWSVDGGRGATGPMETDGRHVYLGGADRQVRAIDLETGAETWHRRLTGTVLGGVLLRDSTLFLATSRPQGRVLALDQLTGRDRWTASSGDISTPLAISSGLVAGMNRRGELVASDIETGTIRWRRKLGLSRLPPLPLADGFLVATADSILRVEASAGRMVQGKALRTAPISWQLAGNRILIASGDSSVTALGRADLAQHWRTVLDGPLLGSIAVNADTLWGVTRVGTVYEVLMSRDTAAARVVAALRIPVTSGVSRLDDLLVIGGADGVLRGLNRNGDSQWRVNLSWNITVPPIAVPDGFVAVGGDGDLYRFIR